MHTGWFVESFQPFHEGHQAIIEKIHKECSRVVILIREQSPQQNPERYDYNKNPYSAELVKKTIDKWINNRYDSDIVTVIIPDFTDNLTLYHGREIGLETKEIRLPKKIEDISATKLREDKCPHGLAIGSDIYCYHCKGNPK